MSVRRTDGFTLLEVLVALVVFAILMTGLVQGTQFGVRAWTLQSHAAESQQDLNITDQTLRTLVGTMDPGNGVEGSAYFVGNRRSMAFTARLPNAVEAFGTRQADVVVSVTPAHLLELGWAPHYTTPLGPPPPPHLTGLLRGVDHLELSYWTVGQAPNHWVEDWTAKVVPGLIRITIVFAPGDSRRWPPIIAGVDML